jgi:hypothetical protein
MTMKATINVIQIGWSDMVPVSALGERHRCQRHAGIGSALPFSPTTTMLATLHSLTQEGGAAPAMVPRREPVWSRAREQP